MIKSADLISLFQTMYKEHWDYVWGSAQKGCVDCSGAFVYAYRKLVGKSLPHGSNAIARRWIVGSMLPLSMAQPGMAAFKVRQPGETNYDLPERYKQNGSGYTGDLGDYYHIGLVDNDTRYVLNAKSTSQGFCRDQLTTKNGWDFVAVLKEIDYGEQKHEEEGKRMTAKVVPTSTSKGDTVNMRERASTDSQIIMRVLFGSTVEVITDYGVWSEIQYSGKSGYMQSNFLEYEGIPDDSDAISDDDRKAIDDALKAIEQAVETISGIIGRG